MEDWLPAVIAALVTGFFAYSVGIKQGESSGVIDDRKAWRDYFRGVWIKELTWVVMNYNQNSYCHDNLLNTVAYLKHQYMVRMNPKLDNKILDHIEKLHKMIDDGDQKSDINECADYIVHMMSRLLKEDWERVKTDLSLLGKFPAINVLILSGLYAAIVHLIVSFTAYNPDKGWLLWGGIGIATLVIVKLILGELEKIPEFRQVFYPNFLDDFPNLGDENNNEKKKAHLENYEQRTRLENAIRKIFVLVLAIVSISIVIAILVVLLRAFEIMPTLSVQVVFGSILLVFLILIIVITAKIFLRIIQRKGGS